MANKIRDDEVRRRVPNGLKLPARFDDFLRATPPFPIEWNDLYAYSLKPTAMKEAVPFLRLPDGGLVAFWYHTAEPAIVHIGGHGELEVVARDFEDFLKGINARCSGLPDFDDVDHAFHVPEVKGMPTGEGIPALQKLFNDWFKKHTSLQEPLKTPETEAVRQRVYRIAEGMIRDGCSKVYTPASTWWSMEFRIERSATGFSITYLDFGKWYPVVDKHKLAAEVVELLNLVEHKNLNQYQLSVCIAGIVSIDDDRELVLVPPEKAG